MDLTSLMGTLLSDNNVKSVSEKAGVDAGSVASVMAAALPALLNGANQQATSKDTAESFQQAVESHASKNPDKVDATEGEKILNHLLGDDAEKTEKAIAKSTGLSKSQVVLILAALAPVIMNMLGKETSNTSNNSASSLLGTLLGGNSSNSSASNSLLTSALSGVLSSAMGSSNSNSSSSILGSVLSAAASSSAQQSQSSNSSSDLLSGLLGAALGGNSSQSNSSSSSNSGSGSSLLSGLMGLLK